MHYLKEFYFVACIRLAKIYSNECSFLLMEFLASSLFIYAIFSSNQIIMETQSLDTTYSQRRTIILLQTRVSNTGNFVWNIGNNRTINLSFVFTN